MYQFDCPTGELAKASLVRVTKRLAVDPVPEIDPVQRPMRLKKAPQKLNN